METNQTMMGVIQRGGPVMWPLLVLCVTVVVVGLDGFLNLYQCRRGEGMMVRPSESFALSLLDFIATTAPVLGFLGTVAGMISAFGAVSESTTVQLPVVAGGLYEALFTTAFGLMVSLLASMVSFLLEFAMERIWEEEDDSR
jgi:biopolymer transport protein ExbB/TolQ